MPELIDFNVGGRPFTTTAATIGFDKNSLLYTVTAMTKEMAEELAQRLKQPISPIEKAGIAPTYEQLEMCHYILPHCSFVQLLEIFYSICSVDKKFFLSQQEEFLKLGKHLDPLSLSLKEKYTFCLVPINVDKPFLITCFIRMVQKYSKGNVITYHFVNNLIRHVLKPTDKMSQFDLLVDAYDFVGAYLWLSYRFEDYFPHAELVRDLENSIHEIINESLVKMTANADINTKEEMEGMSKTMKLKELSKKLRALEDEIRDLQNQ